MGWHKEEPTCLAAPWEAGAGDAQCGGENICAETASMIIQASGNGVAPANVPKVSLQPPAQKKGLPGGPIGVHQSNACEHL